MICELIRQGKKVGVTAGSHKVIRNLLDAVGKAGRKAGLAVKLGHRKSAETTTKTTRDPLRRSTATRPHLMH